MFQFVVKENAIDKGEEKIEETNEEAELGTKSEVEEQKWT